MSSPYVGEIRIFGGNFAPAGWMFCEGQLLPISENETLFNLIGTTYGGDGQETFALPDLRGRLPIHMGTGPGLSTYVIGEMSGTESVTLTVNQLPNHTHPPTALSSNGNANDPANRIWANAQSGSAYTTGSPTGATLNPTTLAPIGGSQPHENMQPYLCVSFIISLFGIYPSQS